MKVHQRSFTDIFPENDVVMIVHRLSSNKGSKAKEDQNPQVPNEPWLYMYDH